MYGLEAASRFECGFNGLGRDAVLCPSVGGLWSNRAPYGLVAHASQEASAFTANGLHRARRSFDLVTFFALLSHRLILF